MNDSTPQRRRVFVPARLLRIGGTIVAILVILVWVWLSVWPEDESVDPFDQGLEALERRDREGVAQAIAALEEDPGAIFQRSYLQGALAVEDGDLAGALQALQAASESEKLRTRAMVLGGQAMYQAGHAGDAQQMWQAVIDTDPQAIDAHRWLGALYYDVGAMNHALRHLKQVNQLAPEDPRPDRLMGRINKDYERFERAVEHYRESLRRGPQQPGHEQVRIELAESLVKLRDYDAALQVLEDVPDTAQKLVLTADCLASLGRAEEALETLRRALALSPELVEGLLLKANVLIEQGDFPGSLELLQRVVERHPRNYQARFRLVQALRRTGQEELAEQHEVVADELREKWQQFSELHIDAVENPEDAAMRFQLGELAEDLGRPELAVNWYRAVMALDPRHAAAAKRLQALLNSEDATTAVGSTW